MRTRILMRCLLLLFTISTTPCLAQVKKDTTTISQMLSLMDSIYTKVNMNYVENVPMQKMMRKGIDAMFESLDPFTIFMSKEEAADFHLNLSGKFGGTGMAITQLKNQIVVTQVFDGNPAAKAGIVPGDAILEVDGMLTAGKTIDDVRHRLMGEPGKPVSITVKHMGTSEPVKLTVIRDEIRLSAVPYYGMLTFDIGYIKFSVTSENSSEEVKQALLDLKRNNKLKGLVLDIRENGGGYASQAIKIANFFIDKGNVILRIKGRNEDSVKYATETAIDKSLPLVLLTSSATASAAEILSGAIQDNDRGVIIGEKTFGKGLIGQIYKMGNGAEIVLTTAYYHTPSGRCIQSKNYWASPGSGIETADSLKRMYKTKNGRLVKEAEGIIPDLHIAGRNDSGIVEFLTSNPYIFEAAIEYKMKHPTIAAAKDFYLTDAEYETLASSFKEKISGYSTETNKKLIAMKSTAAKEGYFAAMEPAFTKLEVMLRDEKMNALEKNKSEIKDLLEQEISYLYYGVKGSMQSGFRNDDQLKKAIEILSNTETFHSILRP